MPDETPSETPTPPASETPQTDEQAPVPYARFAAVNARLKAAEDASAAATARIEAAEKRALELEGAVVTEKVNASIASAGIKHPKAVDTVRALYLATPDRADFATWYAAFAKENPWFNAASEAPKAPSLNGNVVDKRPRNPTAGEIAKMSKAELDAYLAGTGGRVSLR
jgi:hypothetical protein